MKSFLRKNRMIQAIRKQFIPIYDKAVYYVKYHRLFTGLWAALLILIVVLGIGLVQGWGVDKSLPGIYFKPEIEKCENEKINSLIGNYYISDTSGDVATLKSLYIDPDSIETVTAKNAVIEYYENFEIYCVKGIEDYSYVVYVTWNIKFTGIDTTAPGLEVFYLVSEGEDKNLLLQNELSETQQEYVDELKFSEDVMTLYETTDTKLLKALEDVKLKEFYDFLLTSSKK